MTLQLIVSKLARASCLHTLTTAIKKIDVKANAKADTKTKIISVETQTSETVFKKASASLNTKKERQSILVKLIKNLIIVIATTFIINEWKNTASNSPINQPRTSSQFQY